MKTIMKKQGSLALLTGMIVILAACTSTSEPDSGITLSGALAGVWVFEDETDGGAKVYSRAPALSGDRDGFEFGEHGGLKVRTTGWCGTPITWSNHEGIWHQVEGRVLEIRHAWRGAPQQYQLEIISLSPRRLTCRQRIDDGS